MEKDINKICQEIYEEIEFFRRKSSSTVKTLCEKAFHQMDDDDEILDDEREEKKYYEKYKKLFKRQSWKENKANKRTLVSLEKFKNSIYKTEKYKATGRYLSPTLSKGVKNISEELEKKLKTLDSEE